MIRSLKATNQMARIKCPDKKSSPYSQPWPDRITARVPLKKEG
jgi:hypothetical protein